MKKRRFRSLMGLALFLVMLAGCTPSSKGERLDQVKKDRLLRVATETTYPPMEFIDEQGQAIGFDMDVMKEIGKNMGVKVEFVSTNFDGMTTGLLANRYDVIAASMTITEERKKKILFSNPYIDAVGLAVIVKAEDDKTKGFDDLKGKKIGIQQGSTSETYVETRPDLGEVKRYIGITEALSDLAAGRSQAVITDSVVGDYFMKENKSTYKMLPEMVDAAPLGYGLPLNSPALKAEIDKQLKVLKDSGTLSRFSLKWFGRDIYQ